MTRRLVLAADLGLSVAPAQLWAGRGLGRTTGLIAPCIVAPAGCAPKLGMDGSSMQSQTRIPTLETVNIGVIGLGYVGLPLAAHLGRKFPVVGFDINRQRISELEKGHDRTRECTKDDILAAKKLKFSHAPESLKETNLFIVTVPTPIDAAKRPDLTPLVKASETVGKVLRKGGIVVYESTVYPGATEEICIPVIEKASGLKYNVDFFAGYSPERINPSDHARPFPKILKITSGSTPEVAELVDQVYRAVVTAGTHKASSIRVAEAAKVIENVQRDVNIALVNELGMLFKRMGLETREVLEAAGTKWNFHYYRPGLVGGHCIGVDPYYLTHKAQEIGFHPEMILAGRRINDGMAAFVAQDIIKTMLQKRLRVDGARILVLGFAFKQNCPDVRNTKVFDLVNELRAFGHDVTVYDPLVLADEVRHEYQMEIAQELPKGPFDAIVLAVRHDEFVTMGAEKMRAMLVPGGLLYDLKEVLPVDESDARV
jgi:UDP-N-acetyl-D-galactosamine dehydrogenase